MRLERLGAFHQTRLSFMRALLRRLKADYDAERIFTTLPCYEDFYRELDYVVLRTSWGCPFNCSYCAIAVLSQGFTTVGVEPVVTFIKKYRRRGIEDIVFYDDALLVDRNLTYHQLE